MRETPAELLSDGYFSLPRVDWPFLVESLAAAVAILVQHGFHPVWIVVFDEVAKDTRKKTAPEYAEYMNEFTKAQVWCMAHALRSLMKLIVHPELEFSTSPLVAVMNVLAVVIAATSIDYDQNNEVYYSA